MLLAALAAIAEDQVSRRVAGTVVVGDRRSPEQPGGALDGGAHGRPAVQAQG